MFKGWWKKRDGKLTQFGEWDNKCPTSFRKIKQEAKVKKSYYQDTFVPPYFSCISNLLFPSCQTCPKGKISKKVKISTQVSMPPCF